MGTETKTVILKGAKTGTKSKYFNWTRTKVIKGWSLINYWVPPQNKFTYICLSMFKNIFMF